MHRLDCPCSLAFAAEDWALPNENGAGKNVGIVTQ